MRTASSNHRVPDPDRALVALLGLLLILAVSLAPHFGFVPSGANHFLRCQHSHAKQQFLANDALQWTVPPVQFSSAAPGLVLRGTATAETSSCFSRFCAPQLYNRPPPSA